MKILPLGNPWGQNYGTSDAYFINLPTRAYDPTAPDNLRLPANHPGIPYSFG